MSPDKSYDENIEAYFRPAKVAVTLVGEACDRAFDVFQKYPPSTRSEMASIIREMGRMIVEMADAWEKRPIT